jgi:peroxiredoxin family protein
VANLESEMSARPLVDATTESRLRELEAQVARLAGSRPRPAGLTIIAFSGDMDKLLAAFMLANGAAAMGMPVTMFFTFWALAALKRKTVFKGKRAFGKFVTAMLPAGPRRLGPSRWSMFGLGRLCFDALMRRQHLSSLPDLIALAREMNVRIVACETAMAVMAITRDELVDGLQFGGVASCLDAAQSSAATFFV